MCKKMQIGPVEGITLQERYEGFRNGANKISNRIPLQEFFFLTTSRLFNCHMRQKWNNAILFATALQACEDEELYLPEITAEVRVVIFDR